MLTIREEQITQMNQQRAATYHKQLASFYRQRVPVLVDRFTDEELYARVAVAARKARHWNIESADGILQFVGLSLAAGPMFDEDPKVQEFLSLPGRAVEHKIRRLLELVGEYLKGSSNIDSIG